MGGDVKGAPPTHRTSPVTWEPPPKPQEPPPPLLLTASGKRFLLSKIIRGGLLLAEGLTPLPKLGGFLPPFFSTWGGHGHPPFLTDIVWGRRPVLGVRDPHLPPQCSPPAHGPPHPPSSWAPPTPLPGPPWSRTPPNPLTGPPRDPPVHNGPPQRPHSQPPIPSRDPPVPNGPPETSSRDPPVPNGSPTPQPPGS